VELIYFPIRGEAELIRLLLVEAGIDYKDSAINSKALLTDIVQKSETVFHEPPILKIGETCLCQTRAIEYYLAATNNLQGSNYIELSQSFALVEIVSQLRDKLDFHALAKNLPEVVAKKDLFLNTWLPCYFSAWEEQLEFNSDSDGQFLVGNQISVGDLAVWNYINYFKESAGPCNFDLSLLQKYPKLSAFYDTIKRRKNIASYLNSPKCYRSSESSLEYRANLN